MKLTVILLTLTCFQVSAKGWGQDKISLTLKDAPLEQALSSIKSQTDYSFVYRPEYVKGKKITINITNVTITSALDLCLKNQKLTYEIVGKNVVIYEAKKESKIPDASETIQTNELQNNGDVKGRVVDANGQPIAGATITVQGTSKTVVSNADGSFTLTGINENAVIVISHVQYETQNLAVNGRSIVNATLQIKINSLDEVQMIAYGTSTKRFNTGSVSSIKSNQIEKQNINNPLLALQARVPGVFITQNSGVPGAGISVQIRGINSIRSGNDPLYVIDGVPYTSQLLPNLGTNILENSGSLTSGNPFSFINPPDIESISVLKDADATAIYGSRGANGVVLITTKKGTANKLKVSFNLSTGFGSVAKRFNFMNTEEYINMRREAFKNDGVTPTVFNARDLLVWDTTRYTDWQNELIGGTANYTRAQTSLSGGTVNTQYLVSVNYNRETSVFPSDFSDQKASVHISVNPSSTNQKFKSSFIVNYLVDDNKLPDLDLTQFIITPPNTPEPFNQDGSLNWTNWPSSHPFAFTKRLYKSLTNNLVSNVSLSYELLKNLVIKSSFGYTNMQVDETSINPIAAMNPANNPSGTGKFAKNSIQSWIVEPQIIYQSTIGNGKLEFLSGLTFQKHKSISDIFNGSGYTSDLLLESIQAAPRLSISSSMSLYKYNAAFARLNYIHKNKYIVNSTVRRDGSSRFGDNNKFHTFGSLGAGWIFSSENFVRNSLPFLSFGKLRASFGTTGNDQIGDYSYYNLYSSNSFQPYQGTTGVNPTRIYNPDLEWEETEKFEGAIDLGFLNDKLLISASYYNNRSSNQLLSNAISSVSGFTVYPTNLPATVQNNGWEITLNTINIIKTKRFDWSSSINIAIPRNKLIAFPNLERTSYANSLIIGKPIKITRAFSFAGVNDTTGVYQFFDNKGNVTYSPAYGEDYIAIINTAPVYYGGFTNSFGYYGFQLDFTFQFTKRAGANPLLRSLGGRSGINVPAEFLARWQNPGDETSLQRFTQSTTSSAFLAYQNYVLFSDYAYVDASFIRLKNVAISYSPSWDLIKRMKFQALKFYIIGQNLLTITKFKGLDPENPGFPGTSPALPPLRVVTFGLEVSF